MRLAMGRFRFSIEFAFLFGFGCSPNGFQGVPECRIWVPYAMLANRRSRSRLPLRGSMAALAAHCKEHRAHKHHRHKVQQQGKQIKLLFLLLYRLGSNLQLCGRLLRCIRISVVETVRRLHRAVLISAGRVHLAVWIGSVRHRQMKVHTVFSGKFILLTVELVTVFCIANNISSPANKSQ